MFRKTLWRKTVSDAISWHQDQALNTVIYILKEFGPTGFLLKENGEAKNLKVCLGDPHTCTCPTFQKEKELCKHICWILMRKFRLPRDHEYCFQLGLVERQILEVLQGSHGVKTPRPTEQLPPEQQSLAEQDGSLRQKDIEEDDVCPICQEELFSKHLPVAHCRYGCGNSIHISCMKIWADHQPHSETDTMVKCPLCREDFGPMKLLLEQARNVSKLQTSSEKEPLNKHLGIICNNCRILPITGKCYKCSTCKFFHLCEDCMKRGIHVEHTFGVRLRGVSVCCLACHAACYFHRAVCGELGHGPLCCGSDTCVSKKRSQQWVQLQQFAEEGKAREGQSGSPMALHGVLVVKSEPVPEAVLSALPLVRVREGGRLLGAGMQCRICLRAFQTGQRVRHLPCHHKFHRECIDGWLHESNCCPLDGFAIYNPLTWGCSAGIRVLPAVSLPPSLRGTGTHPSHDLCSDLFVPGVGLRERERSSDTAASIPRVESSVSSVCLSSPRPPRTLAVGRPSPANAAAHDLAVSSVRIERPRPHPRRTSDTELARTRASSSRARPLMRCQSLSLAPLSPHLVKGSGLSRTTRPNVHAPPPSSSSSSTSTTGPRTAAPPPHSGDTLTGLYVGGSPLGGPAGGSSMGGGPQGQPVRSSVPRRVRALGRARSTLLGPPGVGEVTLWMTGVYISGPSPQKK